MGKKLLVDTITKHISPDGVLRKPRSSNSRFYLELEDGEEPYKHVIVVGEEVDITSTDDGDNENGGGASDDGEETAFKDLKSEEQLEKIAGCEDKIKLAEWAEDLNKNSNAYKAILEKQKTIEFDFNNGGGDGDNE